MNERKIGRDEVVAANHADAGVETLGEPDRLLFERVGPERIGRRVDEIAAEADRRGDALDFRRVDAIGRDQPGLGRGIGLEAVVAIEPEQESERGEIGVGGRVGEAVDAFGQRGRELAGGERIAHRRVDRLDAEQHAGERSGLVRKKLQSTGLGLEAAALGEGGGRFADRRLDLLPVFGADEPDRRRVGRRRGERGQGQVSTSGNVRSRAYTDFVRPSSAGTAAGRWRAWPTAHRCAGRTRQPRLRPARLF